MVYYKPYNIQTIQINSSIKWPIRLNHFISKTMLTYSQKFQLFNQKRTIKMILLLYKVLFQKERYLNAKRVSDIQTNRPNRLRKKATHCRNPLVRESPNFHLTLIKTNFAIRLFLKRESCFQKLPFS